MEKLKIDSKAAKLIAWLMSEGFYIPLNIVCKDSVFEHKVSDAIALQKKAIRYLRDSLKSSQTDNLALSINIISCIALVFFHSSLLMDQPKFWRSCNKEKLRESIDRFAKQNYFENTQFSADLTTICNFVKLVEIYLISRKDFASNFYYDKSISHEHLITSKINYLIPIRPTKYNEAVLDFFNLFFGGYKNSNFKHMQMYKMFKASCYPFDEEHVLISKDIALALMSTTYSKLVNKKWTALIEDLSTNKFLPIVKTLKERHSEKLNDVFPKIERLSTMVGKNQAVLIPKPIFNEINHGYQFVFHQSLDTNSSLIELTTIDAIMEQFLDMVLFKDELTAIFKKVEYAQIGTEMALPTFCDVEPNDTIYLIPEGVRIGIIKKREYDACVQEYKKLIQE